MWFGTRWIGKNQICLLFFIRGMQITLENSSNISHIKPLWCWYIGLWSVRHPIVIWLGTLPLCVWGRGVVIVFQPRPCSILITLILLVPSLWSVRKWNGHEMTQGVISCMRTCNYFPIRIQTSNGDSYRTKEGQTVNSPIIYKYLPWLTCDTRDYLP